MTLLGAVGDAFMLTVLPAGRADDGVLAAVVAFKLTVLPAGRADDSVLAAVVISTLSTSIWLCSVGRARHNGDIDDINDVVVEIVTDVVAGSSGSLLTDGPYLFTLANVQKTSSSLISISVSGTPAGPSRRISSSAVMLTSLILKKDNL